MAETAAASRRTIIAGIAGNVMEWYDFAVYGFFAATIGSQFFPADDPLTSTIAAFGVFAAGFMMRPLGGAFFGYIGDKIGRKAALTFSVIAMAVPTFMIGLLPTHASIGVTAAVLLVLMRLIQGLSVGGEYTSSVVYLVESAGPRRRGLMGSWGTFGAVAGILLGSAISALVTGLLTTEQINDWGWRIPFMLGLGVGVTGLFIRRHVTESDPAAVEEAPKSPLVEAFKHERRAMLKVAGFNILNAVGFYMMFVYVTTYLREEVHFSVSDALDVNTINMILLLLIIPSAGLLSDYIGRRKVLMTSAIGVILLGYPLFRLLHHDTFVLALLGQAGFALLVGLFLGAGPAAMVEEFPRRVRCSALSVGYNVSLAIFGGTTPLVASYVIERSHNDYAPAFYLIGAAVVSLGVILTLKETAGKPLDADAEDAELLAGAEPAL